MTGHFRITGKTWATANLTVDGEPFPYDIEGVSWHLNRNGLPILAIEILPDQLTIETTNAYNDQAANSE